MSKKLSKNVINYYDSKKIKIDFILRDKDSLIPIEVKANDNATISLNNIINNKSYKDIKYGIKI